MSFLIDPRQGDVEDDASSPKQKSLLSLAGGLLVEISLPKLALSWLLLIALPCLLLGLAPLAITAWGARLSQQASTALSGLWPLLLLVLVVVGGVIGGKPAFRLAERSFWALNALAIQPSFALWREGLRHLANGWLAPRPEGYGRATALGAGLAMSLIALVTLAIAWPFSRWLGDFADLAAPMRLIWPALANSVVIISAYIAVAALCWGIADGAMDQPVDLGSFADDGGDGTVWRVAHLSDLHAVGERYGFRIECGRGGPQGNGRIEAVLAALRREHAREPLDLVLITGDMTDAGRATEWAEFLALAEAYPELLERMLLLPGNHDVNVVDRANPARLDLPGAPGKLLRQLRSLAFIAGVHGGRVRVVAAGDEAGQPAAKNLLSGWLGRLGAVAHFDPQSAPTLDHWLAPSAAALSAFADTGKRRRASRLRALWDGAFPMVVPPATANGLGVLLLDSNADTHFSFTNALGLVTFEQNQRLKAVVEAYPQAHWIIALHHHMVEYPRPTAQFSERIGTALINGSWFVRQLQPLGARAVVMHGHRHTDWIGRCGPLRIVSAPSPVMGEAGECYFYIHRLRGRDRALDLLAPQRIDIG